MCHRQSESRFLFTQSTRITASTLRGRTHCPKIFSHESGTHPINDTDGGHNNIEKEGEAICLSQGYSESVNEHTGEIRKIIPCRGCVLPPH
ncbi:hypothetical protein CEXT_250041 [Caerostris extrusa]|uniref:Uncharacterized protein n=1 Tax=Caerostris extrusa TaxID=172846 RepID=A0AAV4XEH7_CAEEX|nr:hypothetical protein CEXT_250041 [Caerostris extrusa]